LQTKTDIRRLLADAGLRPNKKLGQHFLIDGNLMRKLVTSAELRPDDVALEVGCGTGSLTQELAAGAGSVIAVEVDRGLAAVAAAELATLPNVSVLHRDVLAAKHRIDPVVLDSLAVARHRLGGRAVLVANLPYQVASPLMINLLIGPVELSRMCFTVQKEVADRLFAQPGGAEYGPLSIIVRTLSEAERITNVPPQAFWPRPRVESTMVRLDPSPDRRREVGQPDHFAFVVRTCFLHRRKTLAHNLTAAYGADVTMSALAEGAIPPQTRPEELPPPAWVQLAKRLRTAGLHTP